MREATRQVGHRPLPTGPKSAPGLHIALAAHGHVRQPVYRAASGGRGASHMVLRRGGHLWLVAPAQPWTLSQTLTSRGDAAHGPPQTSGQHSCARGETHTHAVRSSVYALSQVCVCLQCPHADSRAPVGRVVFGRGNPVSKLLRKHHNRRVKAVRRSHDHDGLCGALASPALRSKMVTHSRRANTLPVLLIVAAVWPPQRSGGRGAGGPDTEDITRAHAIPTRRCSASSKIAVAMPLSNTVGEGPHVCSQRHVSARRAD